MAVFIEEEASIEYLARWVRYVLLTGMGYRPMIKTDSTLIRFNKKDADSYKDHLKSIEDLLRRMCVLYECRLLQLVWHSEFT